MGGSAQGTAPVYLHYGLFPLSSYSPRSPCPLPIPLPPLPSDVNLFELLKRNSFHGLSLSLVKLFLRQLLDSLSVLRDASIIHCDLKVRGRGDAT